MEFVDWRILSLLHCEIFGQWVFCFFCHESIWYWWTGYGQEFGPCLYEQIKQPLLAQNLNWYEVTLSEWEIFKACFFCTCKCSLRSTAHEQIKHLLFAQLRTELLDTDLKFEKIKSTYLLHVREASSQRGVTGRQLPMFAHILPFHVVNYWIRKIRKNSCLIGGVCICASSLAGGKFNFWQTSYINHQHLNFPLYMTTVALHFRSNLSYWGWTKEKNVWSRLKGPCHISVLTELRIFPI